MTDEQKREWEHLYDTLMDKPRKIFEIFSDYFGEDKVDFQGFRSKEDFCKVKELSGRADEQNINLTEEGMFILVWFPEVKVTNEHDKSVYVQDLYAKVRIDTNGYLIGKFTLGRATYPLNQIRARYMHSHALINIPNFHSFSMPCTGSGPINSTIAHLNREFDEDLWQLYCSELDDFTQVESLTGVPYRKLEEIDANQNNSKIPHFNYVTGGSYASYDASGQLVVRRGIMLDFTRYLLKSGILPMEYSNGTYCLGLSPLQATVLISNKFIEWFNLEDNPYRRQIPLEYLLMEHVLEESVIQEGAISPVDVSDNLSQYMQYEGRPVCKFKGKDIKLHIMGISSSENNSVLLLSQRVIIDIVSAICKVVNFRYGRKESEKKSKLDRQTLYI